MPKIAMTLSLMLLVFLPAAAGPQSDATSRSWNQPVKPYRIIGNIWYVGASGVTSFLITTSKGHILLDSGLPETAPQIKRNMAQIGFKPDDIKILLNSHGGQGVRCGLRQQRLCVGVQTGGQRQIPADLR